MMSAAQRVRGVLERCRADKKQIGTIMLAAIMATEKEAIADATEMLTEAERQIKELAECGLDLVAQLKDQNNILPAEIDTFEDLCRERVGAVE